MKKLIVLSVLFTGCFANDSLLDKQVEVKAVMQVDTENSHDLEGEVEMGLNKKISAQKIRDYFNTPKWKALTNKREERYAISKRRTR